MSRAATRHGSARFSTTQELTKAGLVDNGGLYHGHTFEPKGRISRPIGFESHAPAIVLGNSGSGKLTTLLAYMLLARQNACFLDPKCELRSIIGSMMCDAEIYDFNPYRLFCGPPWFNASGHQFNLLECTDKNSPTFYEDMLVISKNLITQPSGAGGSSAFFYSMAVKYCTAFLMYLKCYSDEASLGDLYNLVGDISGSGNEDYFGTMHCPQMLDTPYTNIRQVADEIMSKRSGAPQEFSGVMSTIGQAIQILGSPALQMALSGPSTIKLRDFIKSGATRKLFLIIPAHLLEPCAPILRVFFTALAIEQQRNPAEPLHLIFDEAAQMGKFEKLENLFSYGRGALIKTVAIFQNVGQAQKLYGEGFDTLFGNAQSKIILGLASEKSADYVSRHLGKTSYAFDPAIRQTAAATKKMDALQKFMQGGNILNTVMSMIQEDTALKSPERIARQLMTADELIRMPPDHGVLDIQGVGIHPYIFQKTPYFLNPAVAHRFLPNPYHAPFNVVKLPKKNGRFKTVKVISEAVPKALAHLPQYQGGKWSYLEGYCPYKYKRKWFSFGRAKA